MNRKLKLFGLGLIAALAMTAVVVISASASSVDDANPGHFTAESGTKRITGEQTTGADKFKFHAAGQSVECNTVILHSVGAILETQTSLTILPTFENCTMAGNPATVHVNGCHYLFTIGTHRNADNTLDVACPLEKAIEVTATIGGAACTLTFKAQVGGIGLGYTQQGTSGTKTHDFEVTFTRKNTHYERHGGICGLLGTTATNAELTGKFTFKGFDNAGAQTRVTVTGSLD